MSSNVELGLFPVVSATDTIVDTVAKGGKKGGKKPAKPAVKKVVTGEIVTGTHNRQYIKAKSYAVEDGRLVQTGIIGLPKNKVNQYQVWLGRYNVASAHMIGLFASLLKTPEEVEYMKGKYVELSKQYAVKSTMKGDNPIIAANTVECYGKIIELLTQMAGLFDANEVLTDAETYAALQQEIVQLSTDLAASMPENTVCLTPTTPDTKEETDTDKKTVKKMSPADKSLRFYKSLITLARGDLPAGVASLFEGAQSDEFLVYVRANVELNQAILAAKETGDYAALNACIANLPKDVKEPKEPKGTKRSAQEADLLTTQSNDLLPVSKRPLTVALAYDPHAEAAAALFTNAIVDAAPVDAAPAAPMGSPMEAAASSAPAEVQTFEAAPALPDEFSMEDGPISLSNSGQFSMPSAYGNQMHDGNGLEMEGVDFAPAIAPVLTVSSKKGRKPSAKKASRSKA